MSYADFDKWMNSKRNVTVQILDKNHVICKMKKAIVLVGTERNYSGYPSEFTVIKDDAYINIGGRYINHVCSSDDGEQWAVYVDGHECYLFT